jgi:hypothetical protein
MAIARSAIVRPTAAASVGPDGSDHQATQLQIPRTASAADRGSTIRNSPAATPCSITFVSSRSVVRLARSLTRAQVVRHLRLDPYLPPELLPPDWPGELLRSRFTAFRDRFAQRLRDYSTAEATP